MSVTVFFPAYNDALSIGALVENAFSVLREHTDDYEVLVINDGSVDDTASILAAFESKYAPRMRVITHERNQGYGAALRSGFSAATKELVFYTDGDGQYDVKELAVLLARMRPDVALVNGYKRKRSDPTYRVWIGNVYNLFARSLFGVRIRDIDCDFRLIRRSLLSDLELVSTGGTICLELVCHLERTGYEVVEVPVSHYPRLHGRSQFFRVQSLLTTFTQLIGLYMRLKKLKLPIRNPAVRHGHSNP